MVENAFPLGTILNMFLRTSVTGSTNNPPIGRDNIFIAMDGSLGDSRGERKGF